MFYNVFFSTTSITLIISFLVKRFHITAPLLLYRCWHLVYFSLHHLYSVLLCICVLLCFTYFSLVTHCFSCVKWNEWLFHLCCIFSHFIVSKSNWQIWLDSISCHDRNPTRTHHWHFFWCGEILRALWRDLSQLQFLFHVSLGSLVRRGLITIWGGCKALICHKNRHVRLHSSTCHVNTAERWTTLSQSFKLRLRTCILDRNILLFAFNGDGDDSKIPSVALTLPAFN